MARHTMVMAALLAGATLLAAPAAPGEDLGATLAGLARKFEQSMVTVVSETEMNMPMMGQSDVSRSEAVGVVVAEDLVVTATANTPGGMGNMLGGLLGGQFRMDSKELGSHIVGPDGEQYELELVGRDLELGVAFYRFKGEERPPMDVVHFPAEPRAELGDELVVLTPLPKDFSPRARFDLVRVNAVREKPHLTYYSTGGGEPGSLVTRLDGTPLGLMLMGSEEPAGGGDEAGGLGALFSLQSAVRNLVGAGVPIVPADRFSDLIANPPELEEGQKDIIKPWIGVAVQAVPRDMAEFLGYPEGARGVRITKVYPGFPAAAAALESGDLITQVDGEELEVESDRDTGLFVAAIHRHDVGGEVGLSVVTGAGEKKELSLVLVEKPVSREDAPEVEDKDFRLKVREITFWDREELNLPDDVKGVVVKSVERAGWAGLGEISPGDIILEIDGQPVPDTEAAQAILEASKEKRPPAMIFYVLEGTDRKYKKVEPAWSDLDEKEEF